MHEELMEQVVRRENATAAWLAVKRNGGAPGIDGMTTGQLRDHKLLREGVLNRPFPLRASAG